MNQDDGTRAVGGGPSQGSAMPPPPAAFPPPPVTWQQAPVQAGGPGYGPPSRPRSLLRRLWSALLALLFVVLLLALFGSATYNYYAYRAGAPTTATVEHYNRCVGSHSGISGVLIDTNPLFDFFTIDKCSGSWSVGDTSQSGPILGVDSIQPTGSSLDVRVFKGHAYTAAAGKHSLLWMIGIGIPVLIILVIAWWRRRTGRSAFGWLRKMTEFLEFFGSD